MKFKHLIGIALLTLGSASFAANQGAAPGPGHHGHGQGKGLEMLHPMPNLMRVVVKFGDQLNLSEQQAAALAAWREANHSEVHARLEAMMKIRRELQMVSMQGASSARINAYIARMDRLRAEIVAAKIACRNNMHEILNEQQWNKVVALYREHFM